MFLVSFALCQSKGQNLIKNGSFENYLAPPNWNTTGGGFFDYSFFPEHRVVLDWDVFISPDYFNAVCPGTYRGIPVNTFGISYAFHGNAFSGLGLYNNAGETKEYFYQQLSNPLKTDSLYCLSFFISRGDRAPYSVKSIGALFTAVTPTLVSNQYINASPQIVNLSGFLTDTINWTEIKGCFTAQGGEQYVTIGNFNSNANTDTLRIQSTNPLTGPGTDIAYYYVDSVTLWPNNFPTAIKENGKNGEVRVFPNPAQDILNIDIQVQPEATEIEIFDALGNLIISENLTNQNTSLNIHQLKGGLYYYRIWAKHSLIKTGKLTVIR